MRCRMSTVGASFMVLSFHPCAGRTDPSDRGGAAGCGMVWNGGAGAAIALGLLPDALDPLQPGVPTGADGGELSHGSLELRLVHLISTLAPGRGRVNEADLI